MDQNSSLQSSTHSSDTDILIKIPNNFFDPNLKLEREKILNFEKSYFSNDNDFMRELDNFLHADEELHNSTTNEALNYVKFRDSLHQSGIENADGDLNLQEERLKRKHYEQLSSILQKKIVQYQQKTAMFVNMEREKDQTIHALKRNEGLDVENQGLKQKNSGLEKEISETVQVINKFQSKNEVLELKIENLTSTSAEMRNISKKQIHDLEVRLSHSLKVQNDLEKEVEELKAKCKIERERFNKEKHAKLHLDREKNTLKAQMSKLKEEKMKLYERFEREKQNIEMKQKHIFSNMMNDFADKEQKLVKELDMQRAALKNYYQSQLDSALELKVTEFQDQLKNFQEEIKEEAERREKVYNQRAISQLELIVRKNDEEIDLVNRKCSEELELYKVQLLNATRSIETLESKLSEYQIRRHDIAENLHNIMEIQWKKTLEVLTNPFQQNFHDDASSNHHQEISQSSKTEDNSKSEVLRNYIDQLLKQSPKRLQVNEEESNSIEVTENRSHKTFIKGAKPWK